MLAVTFKAKLCFLGYNQNLSYHCPWSGLVTTEYAVG